MTPIDPRELPNDIEALKRLFVAELALRDQKISELEHNIGVLRAMVFAPKSEKRAPQDAHQGHLFFAELAEAAQRMEAAGATAKVLAVSEGTVRKKPGRRKEFPAHLPRFRTVYELTGSERRCACGAELCEMGEETTRELERIESCVVHEIVRKKYCCRTCQEKVVLAPAPARVIDKGLLGVGFQAHVIVERFLHHMPYHRQEKKYAAEGLSISRSVLCATSGADADLLAPIAHETRREMLRAPFIFTDDTPVVVAESSLGGSKQGRIWTYCDGEGRCVYDFSPSRENDQPCLVLADYAGWVHADAYGGYDVIFKQGKAIEVACWAHVRRYFVKAEKSDPKLAKEAIDHIRRIYQVETLARERSLDPPSRKALREEHTRNILDEIFDWMTVTRAKVLDKSPMAAGIDYAMHLRAALYRFLDDGRLEPDNNTAERALRPLAVGRKNWLFFGNEIGGERAAVLYTLVRTCAAIGIDPREYLRDVLLRIGTESDVSKLTPHAWKRHFADEVRGRKQQVLDRLLAGPR